MAIAAGSRLGPYEIVCALGAGGMGEVYKARDTRLERTVAIKVLNSSLIASPGVKARFEREARVISQLQHPNICVLHDVGSENGTDFLVMEFLDGESLADRLRRGPLPIPELLKIAIEVVDALERAHRAGVVHRDLKPGNVMLTRTGAKLLDFGLAKPLNAMVASGASDSLPSFTASPTVSGPSPMASPLTTQGSIVGTVQYMSPEQIQGKEADARSDIFAFGSTVYEMATGQRAFTGKSQIKVASAILEDDPPAIRTVSARVPAELEHTVATCLNKDPEERYQCAHDLKLQLRAILARPAGEMPAKAEMPLWKNPLLWSAVTAALAITVAVALWTTRSKPAEREVTRFDIDLGTLRVVGQSGSRVAISRDGRAMVLMLHGETTKPQLFLRRMDSLELRPLPGTEASGQPFFSPDGRWVGFSAAGKLKKVALEGGVSVTICDLPTTTVAATWGDNGMIVFAAGGDLHTVSADGGIPAPLGAWAGGTPYAWVTYLPGSHGLLAVTQNREGRFDIDLVRMDEHKVENLVQNGSWPRYLSNGFVVYAQYGSGSDAGGFTGGLLAVPFDLKGLKRTGSPTPVLQDVEVGYGGAGFYDIAGEGTIAFIPGSGESPNTMELAWTDASGKVESAGAPLHHIHELQLSPDGTQAAFTVVDGGPDVYTFDLRRRTLQRLTFDKHSSAPIFTADGKRVIYASSPSAPPANLWSKSTDGSGETTRLTQDKHPQSPTSCSPDGETLVYTQLGNRKEIYMLSLHGDPAPRPWLASPFDEDQAVISPDGKFVAYVSDESGAYQVLVRPLSGGGGKWQISESGESGSPQWSKDGTKLFFVVQRKTVMSANVSTKQGFKADAPHAVFESPDFSHSGYSVAAGGKLFWARSERANAKAAAAITRVIENFDLEVARRISAQGK